jgi:hypothetical protein
MGVRQVVQMSDEKENRNENVVKLTTPEFMYLLQRMDLISSELRQAMDNLKQEIKQENNSVKGLIWTTFGLMIGVVGIAVTVAIKLY